MQLARMILSSPALGQLTAQALMQHNEQSAHYGLWLTRQQAKELVAARDKVLRFSGRIEFGDGILPQLIAAFCDSPYITLEHYTATLHELMEIFYHYKNETMDLISDEDLIASMKQSFDGVCQGSLDLLAGRELYELSRALRKRRMGGAL